MKRLFQLALLSVLAVGIMSCSSDNNGPGKGNGDEVEIKQIEIDSTDLAEAPEVIPTDDTDSTFNDYVENAKITRNISLKFNGNSVTATGDVDAVTITTSGAHVTIKSSCKNVAYSLSGYSNDGSIKIYSSNKYKLELNGIALHNPSGAAINNQCGKSLYLVLADGTSNALSDGKAYVPVAGEDMKGTLFSEGQILISGKGSLNVKANARNGICSDDYIVIRPGCKIYVSSTANNTIKANDGVTIKGGVINLSTSGNGAKGINCESNINIEGGRTTVINSGSTLVLSTDTTGCAGLKADSTINVTNGIVNVKCTGEGGKGFNSGADINIYGGDINVVTLGAKKNSAPKGVKADRNISILGGRFYSYSANSTALDVAGTLKLGENPTGQKSGTHYYIIGF